MPIYTISFSQKEGGVRTPFLVDGKPATITVEADNRTSAINHQSTVTFCQGNSAGGKTVTVRGVTP